MLRKILGRQEVDAFGSSDTDSEEECQYDCVVYHLLHQYDMDDPDERKETDVGMKKQKHTLPLNEQEVIIENMEQSSQELETKILFALQHDFVFEWISTKNIYLAHTRDKETCNLVLKIVKDDKCLIQKGYVPMELRILSHIFDNRGLSQNLQELRGFLVVPGGYAFLSPFAANLRDLSKQRDFAHLVHEIKEIIYQLLIALKNLHAMGVIHRDVKQSNILWENNTLTLIDYDLATWDQQGRKHFAVYGTLGYIAPEILQFERDLSGNPRYYDSKIDIYSAGVVFGSLLFNIIENDVSEIHVRAFRQKANELLPNEPLAANLLLSMIDINPERRPSAHTLLQHQFFS